MAKKTIEITRSYSQKIKIGEYLTADFFMSAKTEAAENEVEEKSKELDKLCQAEVKKSIEEYIEANKPKTPDQIAEVEKWNEHYKLISETEEIEREEEKVAENN